MSIKLPSLVWAVRTGPAFLPREYRATELEPGLGHLYFWKISTTEIVKVFPELADSLTGEDCIMKVGYAKACRKNGNYYQIGGVQRARECLRDWEKMAGLPAGTLLARVYVIAVHDANRALACEQYFHNKNQHSDIWFTPWIEAKAQELGTSAPGGKTEFYLGKINSLYGKFLNCQRQSNAKQGWQTIVDNRFRGPSGWKLPVTSKTLEA